MRRRRLRLLPSPDISVKTLRSGALAVDSAGVVFNLRAGVSDASHPSLCMILDTLHYVFHPRAEKFHPLQLTDTTVYPRDTGTQTTTPIALRAVLEGRNGEHVVSSGGGYSPANGMETAYNRMHLLGEEGEAVCLDWNTLGPGVTYVKLRLRSTRPIVINELTWHYLSRT
ncbi:MAG TPA: hypothetical protein VJO33_09855 [Gemmatimonadaceae bacterium]|nr:hypothetical protein [Gemmatimonadaceae bacterium]